jgi:RNase H-like domain found in reverse transcriptase/Reverse transcriptase (RNA-dependent DNA polymerase)
MMMDAIFAEEMQEGWLVIYMDDMLISTDDDPRFHKLCIHRVLTKLAEHDLYLKPEKCVFEQCCVDFLGVVLQHGTIHMDPTKTQGVADWPRPTNVTEVRAFLGFTGFYRYFIPNYSRIARPLLDLTKKTTPWHWGDTQMNAFELLKTLMCRKPVLAQPDYTKPFILHTDASGYGMGAILLQEGDPNPERPLKFCLHPIAYYSATFIPAEWNYDIYE